MNKFTEEQVKNWRRYERVRAGGKYNMFDPRARMAAKLSADEYVFVMDNYAALKQAAKGATV